MQNTVGMTSAYRVADGFASLKYVRYSRKESINVTRAKLENE